MISIIVAADEQNIIGKDNMLPWDLPDEMKFFREKTKGHPIIMGRKNYESIGRPLPHRRNIVITRQESYEAEGCDVVHSLDDAIALVKNEEDIFIIGGGEIYKQAMEKADRIYFTRIHANFDGDVSFPEIGDEWKEVDRSRHLEDDKHECAFTFLTFDRA